MYFTPCAPTLKYINSFFYMYSRLESDVGTQGIKYINSFTYVYSKLVSDVGEQGIKYIKSLFLVLQHQIPIYCIYR
jgi:hypothetical protein